MGRAFGFLALLLAMAAGLYIYAKQGQTLAGPAPDGNMQSVANLTGVKNDLIAIANAERGYMAEQGKYALLEDLVSAHYISIKGERPPYTYDVEISDSGFRVTATRSGPGVPAKMWIDETMQIQSED